MWIVHSLSPNNDLKADDLRRQLIEHAQDPSRLMRALDEKEKRTQSAFEREVMKRLIALPVITLLRNGAWVPFESTWSWRATAAVWPSSVMAIAIIRSKNFRKTWTASPFSSAWAGFSRAIRGTEFLRNPDSRHEARFRKLQMLEISPTAALPRPPRRNSLPSISSNASSAARKNFAPSGRPRGILLSPPAGGA